MSQTEDILTAQKDLVKQIETLGINVTKTGLDRRSPAIRDRRLAELDELWEAIIVNQRQLKLALPAEHPYLSQKFFEQARQKYRDICVKLDSWLPQPVVEAKEKPPTPGPSATTAANPSNAQDHLAVAGPSSATEQSPAPELPKLTPLSIPKFNGSWGQWTGFIGLFESLIETNPKLSPIHKLQYLLNYLEGEARECVGHIPLEAENFAIAMEVLREE